MNLGSAPGASPHPKNVLGLNVDRGGGLESTLYTPLRDAFI